MKERKWKVVPAHDSYEGALSIQVSKMGYKNGVIAIKMNDNLTPQCIGHDKASIAESVCKTWSTRFLRKVLASTYL